MTPDGRRIIASGQFTHNQVDPTARRNPYDVGTIAYDESRPAAVLLTSFAVHGRVVTWRTPAEAGLAGFGFEVWRDGHRLTKRPIASYRYVDRAAAPGRTHFYRLRAVRLDGSRISVASTRTR